MRKLFIAVGLVGTFTMACTKEYNCACTTTNTVTTVTWGGTETVTTVSSGVKVIEARNERDARESCESSNSSVSFPGTSTTISCQLQ